MKRYPKYKDSGIEWLGEIPEHWEINYLKFMSKRITKGTTPSTLGRSFTETGVTFIKVESISEKMTILHEMCTFIDEETHAMLDRSQLHVGDILVGIAGAIGRLAIVDKSTCPANTNQAVAIITLTDKDENLRKWVAYCLVSDYAQSFFQLSTVKTAQANLSLEELGNIIITIPPPHEQRAIAAFLDRETARIDTLIEKIRKSIDLLREYRGALISAAVTGKIDVRERPETQNIAQTKG